jgi:hypothetical protein
MSHQKEKEDLTARICTLQCTWAGLYALMIDWYFRAVIRKADEEQKQLYDFISKHSYFSEGEKNALKIDSVSTFEKQWNLTIDSKGKFEASHDHGVGLAARRAQQFVESAYDVLQHMDPIVQLIKVFGAPYGSMAIGTISFLFTVRTLTVVQIK